MYSQRFYTFIAQLQEFLQIVHYRNEKHKPL